MNQQTKSDQHPISSYIYQYVVMHPGDKNKENSQLGDIVLIDHEILKTNTDCRT